MAGDRRGGAREDDYRTARIAVALVLAGVLGAMLLVDAMSEAYAASEAVVGLLLGGIGALLGVEVLSAIRGPRR